MPNQDPKRYLGKLCPRGHDYKETGQSLRYRSNQMCVWCSNKRGWGPASKPPERRPLPGKRYSQADLDRFWSKVEKAEGCWPFHAWTVEGYPHVNIGGRDVRASRFMVELTTGQEVAEGMVVAHRCDNPRCVNPEHLWLTTQRENIRDRDEKGRTSKGSRRYNFGTHYRAPRMTDEEVAEVRRLRSEGVGTLEIARRLGRSKGAVLGIISGRSHRS